MKTKTSSIGTFEAKTHLSGILENVQKGGEYIITNRGKPIAKLIPYSDHKDKLKIGEIIFHFDSIRNSIKGKINIKEYINEGRKY